ncbi:MAG TPA: PEGA domain-containing protein [Methanoregulaceae archaeon]|nr:PEGA domain-containing protein [Methanoregulaceae archaeon]
MVAGTASAQPSSDQGTNGVGNLYSTGSIYVTSTPAGASAVLDGGEDLVYTPGTFNSVIPGLHNVRITIPGYQAYSATVEVTAGNTNNVFATLNQVIQPGGLSVISNPKGADLYIDDIYMGVTDQIVGNLATGSHNVSLSLAGYELWTGQSNVVPSQVTSLTVSLVPEVNPPSGDLRVASTPEGAAVYVNNDYRGTTPVIGSLDISNLNPGVSAIALKKAGFEDYTTQVIITAGTTTQINAALKATQAPGVATVQIVSSPGGADVYINNQYVGITPILFQNVKTGSYTVEIRLPGYTSYTTTGQANAGQDISLNVALTPAPAPTTKSSGSPLLVLFALGIVGLAGFLACRRYS